MTGTQEAPARPATKPRKRRRSPGWVPNQHGAWAMLVAPLVLGFLLSDRLDWRQLLLTAFWITGYLAFFAVGLWLKSRRKPRYFPPVRAYAVAATVLGLLTAVSAPHLLRWAPLFVVPLAVGLYASATRDERSIWSGLATTAGATLMTPVAFSVAGDWCDMTSTVWYSTLALGTYLAGTVFYVKTMIRQHGSRTWWALSVGWHVAALAVVVAGPLVVGLDGWAAPVAPVAVAVYVILLARAALLPRWDLTPKTVGIVEIVLSTAVVLSLWVGPLVHNDVGRICS